MIRLHGAAKISDQIDMAEIVGVPWMKHGRASSLIKRKQKERIRLMEGDDSMRHVPAEEKE